MQVSETEVYKFRSATGETEPLNELISPIEEAYPILSSHFLFFLTKGHLQACATILSHIFGKKQTLQSKYCQMTRLA